MKPTERNIRIAGARTHNLKNIDLDLPRDQLIVFTGLSGSGKSSLAFDTIYAEGQRRYVESLSAYARQFLSMMEKPDVDHIDGLSPAISIEQKSTSHNPRSTVGTVTEIYDYLRLLFARVGVRGSILRLDRDGVADRQGRVEADQAGDQIPREVELVHGVGWIAGVTGSRRHVPAPGDDDGIGRCHVLDTEVLEAEPEPLSTGIGQLVQEEVLGIRTYSVLSLAGFGAGKRRSQATRLKPAVAGPTTWSTISPAASLTVKTMAGASSRVSAMTLPLSGLVWMCGLP